MQLTGPDDAPTASTWDHAKTVKRNYLLGIANGALWQIGFGFINPSLVLAAFVYERTGSNTLVGLLAALSAAGAFWPQLYMSRLIEHRSRKKPFYVFMAGVRVSMLSAMVAAMWLAGRHESSWLLALFFCAFFALRTADGCGTMPFFDIVGQTIAPTRLGRFFAWRSLLGNSLGMVSGFLIIQPILINVQSPANYFVLGCGAVLFIATSLSLFGCVREEKNHTPPKERSFRQTFAGAARMLKESANYRYLFSIRMLLHFNVLAVAFYVPYGVGRLGAVKLSGVFIAVMAASRMISSLFWGRMSDARGNRRCLLGSGVFFVLSPAAALVAPHLPDAFSVAIPFASVPLDLPLCVYLTALCFFGLATQANLIGLNAFLIESAPPGKRPSYIAFLNTLTGPLTFLPLLAGALVGGRLLALDTIFVVVAAAGILTFVSAMKLSEVRGAAEPAQ